MHGGAELTPRQIPHGPLIAIVGIGELATATGAFQLPIAALSPDPQFQSLVLLVDFLPVYAVSGPLKDSGEVIIGRQLLSLTNRNTFLRRPGNSSFPRIPAQSRFANIQFPLPPIADQQRIVVAVEKRIEELREAAGHLNSALERFPQMEKELLAAAIAGELTPQIPEDESARDLLNRLGPLSAEIIRPPSGIKRKAKGEAVKSKHSSPSGRLISTVHLSDVLQEAGRPLPLPGLFALAGFDRDDPAQVEQFYLALRSELGHTIRRVDTNAENSAVEVISSASE